MLSWVHTQRRLLPPPKFIICLSDKNHQNRDYLSGEVVPQDVIKHFPQSQKADVIPSITGASFNSSLAKGKMEKSDSVGCRSGYHSLPDQGSLSSEDNRSPLTPNSREVNNDGNSLSRSRQYLYPSDHSVPNTPSISPNAPSPSILKHTESSPRMSQTTSMEGMSDQLSPNIVPVLADPPRRSALKKHRAVYEPDRFNEKGELLRSSPDGCSRVQSHAHKSLNYTNDLSADYPTNSLKYTSVPTSCSSCNQSPCCSMESYNNVNITPRYAGDADPLTPQDSLQSNDSNFSPMLMSYEEMLLDQRAHRQTLSEEANKTLEAVENDLRELCNLPRTKHYSGFSSSLTRQDTNAEYDQNDSSKSRFNRQHGSFKRQSEKLKPAFDRTRSAVDLTAKTDEGMNNTNYELERNMSSSHINYREEAKTFNGRNMEAIGRSTSAKSLSAADSSGNSYPRKNSTPYGYCSSSLPKRKNFQNFRNSHEEGSSPPYPNDQLSSTLKNTVRQVINYELEDFVRHHDHTSHRKQSSACKTDHFSSLPYSYSKTSPDPNNRNAGSSSLRKDSRGQKEYHADQSYSLVEPMHQCAQSPVTKTCPNMHRYYQEKVPREYDPGQRGSMSRQTAYRYGNQRHSLSPNSHSFERFACASQQCQESNETCPDCDDPNCMSSRSLATTPLDGQKDFHIPNYFSNNSKGSAIPASLMPRYQAAKEAHQDKHMNHAAKDLTRMDSRYNVHVANARSRNGSCGQGCRHDLMNHSGYYNHQQHASVDGYNHSGGDGHNPQCCNGHRGHHTHNYRSDSSPSYPACHDPRSGRRPSQHQVREQSEEPPELMPTTWSWEQRIADVEKSYPSGPQWCANSTDAGINYVQHKLPSSHQRHFVRADSVGNQRSESHSHGCSHFTQRDMHNKLAHRRRSLGKELADFAFGGPPRRTISCLPANIVRNALSSHDPSYKLLKADPDDDPSEAGTSAAADPTAYRYV